MFRCNSSTKKDQQTFSYTSFKCLQNQRILSNCSKKSRSRIFENWYGCYIYSYNFNRRSYFNKIRHKKFEEATPEDKIVFNLKGLSAKDKKKGYACVNTKDDISKKIRSFQSQVIILKHPGQIQKGYCSVLSFHTTHIACKFQELKQKINRNIDAVIEEELQYQKAEEVAIVQFFLRHPMC